MLLETLINEQHRAHQTVKLRAGDIDEMIWLVSEGAGNGADWLGLTDLLEVPVRYLSTGQKKRAALARLIGQSASIWLLDEPLNGLDSKGVALVEERAAEHCRAGGIAVIASHQRFALRGMARVELRDFAA